MQYTGTIDNLVDQILCNKGIVLPRPVDIRRLIVAFEQTRPGLVAHVGDQYVINCKPFEAWLQKNFNRVMMRSTRVQQVAEHLGEAAKWLSRLRGQGCDYLSGDYKRWIEEALAKAGSTLGSIGTSPAEIEKLLLQAEVNKAIYWLNSFRREGCDDPQYAEYVREYTKRGHCSLTSIGTEEEELNRLWHEANKNKAKYWLAAFRRKGCQDPQYAEYVEEYVGKAECSLAEIGTSTEELARLVVTANKNKAIYWLNAARREGCQDPQYVDFVMEYRRKAGCTLRRIKTSKKELFELKRLAFKNKAAYWLGRLRDPGKSLSNTFYVSWIREAAKKARCTLAELGTNRSELRLALTV